MAATDDIKHVYYIYWHVALEVTIALLHLTLQKQLQNCCADIVLTSVTRCYGPVLVVHLFSTRSCNRQPGLSIHPLACLSINPTI